MTRFLQIDPASIGVGGDSAGGNLASAVALKARDAALEPALAFQILAYPCNDYSMSGSSYTEFAQGFGLTTRAMKWFWEQYLGPGFAAPPSAYAAPMLAHSFSSLPPAVIIVAECDPLASDSASYAELLTQAGVEVKTRTFAGMNHGFITHCAVTPRAHEALEWVAAEVKCVLTRRK
jgi:acetyl esterase